jgi:sirohydrochlorin ferrochelatase
MEFPANQAMTGLVIFAHGSSVPEANQAVQAVTTAMQRQGGYAAVETAFLEAAKPDLADAVAALAVRGITRIVVIPYFLTLGIHLRRDLPNIVAELMQKHPGISIEVTPPLDGHPALVEILLARAAAALPA